LLSAKINGLKTSDSKVRPKFNLFRSFFNYLFVTEIIGSRDVDAAECWNSDCFAPRTIVLLAFQILQINIEADATKWWNSWTIF